MVTISVAGLAEGRHLTCCRITMASFRSKSRESLFRCRARGLAVYMRLYRNTGHPKSDVVLELLRRTCVDIGLGAMCSVTFFATAMSAAPTRVIQDGKIARELLRTLSALHAARIETKHFSHHNRKLRAQISCHRS